MKEPFPVDFAKHAEVDGRAGAPLSKASPTSARRSNGRKTTDRTTVITIVSDAFTWTPGDAGWDVGVPEVSEREQVREAHAAQAEGRKRQRVGV